MATKKEKKEKKPHTGETFVHFVARQTSPTERRYFRRLHFHFLNQSLCVHRIWDEPEFYNLHDVLERDGFPRTLEDLWNDLDTCQSKAGWKHEDNGRVCETRRVHYWDQFTDEEKRSLNDHIIANWHTERIPTNKLPCHPKILNRIYILVCNWIKHNTPRVKEMPRIGWVFIRIKNLGRADKSQSDRLGERTPLASLGLPKRPR